MATTDDNMKDVLVTLAKDVAKKAGDVDILADKVDALKAVAAVYAVLKKHKIDDPDEDTEEGFDFQRGVAPEEPSNESTVTRLPTRRRPG